MKRLVPLPITCSTILAAAFLACRAHAAATAAGFVDFGSFQAPASGGEFVEVNLKSNLIALAARLVEKQEPDASALLRSVHSVRVNVIALDKENRAGLEQRVKGLRADLAAKGWERVVTAQKDKEDVAVYLKLREDQGIEGLVVTVIGDGKEAVFINVAGDIKPEQLAALGDKLNLEPLKQAGQQIKQP